MNFDQFIKLGYLYLLGLSIFSFYLCLKNGPKMVCFRATIYYVYILIFGLSLVQVRDCVYLLINPIKDGWWIPLICKHTSLWAYVLILLCVDSCTVDVLDAVNDAEDDDV